MGGCASSPAGGDVADQGGGELHVALYDYNPGEPGRLKFNKGDTIVVTGDGGDRFTMAGHVQGSRTRGLFPVTYVKKSSSSNNPGFDGASTGDGDRGGPAMQLKTWNKNARATRSALKGTHGGNKQGRGIRWIASTHTELETYAKLEYARGGDFDPEKANDAWELEEHAERTRQNEVRWQYFERDMQPGEKCQERLEATRMLANKAEKERIEKERRREVFLQKRQQQKDMAATRDERLTALRLARTARGDTMHKGDGHAAFRPQQGGLTGQSDSIATNGSFNMHRDSGEDC